MLLKLQLVSFEEEEPDGSVDVGGNQSPAVEDVLPGAGDREALNVKIQGNVIGGCSVLFQGHVNNK